MSYLTNNLTSMTARQNTVAVKTPLVFHYKIINLVFIIFFVFVKDRDGYANGFIGWKFNREHLFEYHQGISLTNQPIVKQLMSQNLLRFYPMNK